MCLDDPVYNGRNQGNISLMFWKFVTKNDYCVSKHEFNKRQN